MVFVHVTLDITLLVSVAFNVIPPVQLVPQVILTLVQAATEMQYYQPTEGVHVLTDIILTQPLGHVYNAKTDV